MGKYTKEGQKYYNDNGQQICGAQLRKQPKGRRCQRRTTEESPRCSWHGGGAHAIEMRGEGSPAYKDGSRSRYSAVSMPKNLAARYQQAMEDPEYLSMRAELAIVDGLLAQRLETLLEGGSGASWSDARKQMRVFEQSMASGDVTGMRTAVADLQETINAGASEYAARDELLKLIRERQKVSESIQKSMISMRQVVTAEQATVLLNRVVDLIRDNVTDRKEKRYLMGSIIGILGTGSDV